MTEETIERIDLERALLAIADPGRGKVYDLGEPVARGGRLWASDAAIAVWVPTDRPDDLVRTRADGSPEQIRFPDLTFLLERQPTSWFSLAHPGEIDCDECQGVGQLESGRCRACRGSGNCETCSGSGRDVCCCCDSVIPCVDCDGKGACANCRGCGLQGPTECPSCEDGPQDFFGVRCTRRWLRKVLDLQSLGPLEVGVTTDGNLAFRVGELEGVLSRRKNSYGD